jgi:RHS repeat-associated protein
VFYAKGEHLLGEYDNAGTLKRENIHLGHALVAYENAGSTSTSCPTAGSTTTSYLITDPLSSPIAASDACGNVLWQQPYLPFGSRTQFAAVGQNDQWFTGKIQDDLSQLVNMGARQYSPAFGRFMSTDPQPVTAENHFSFNRYAYANNNPYRYNDPTGQSIFEIGFLIADTAELVSAVKSGHGIGLAVVNELIDVVGVACPVPGVSEAAHAIEAVGKIARVAEESESVAHGFVEAEQIANEAAKGGTSVYSAIKNGVTKYVGITDDLTARAAAHLRQKGIIINEIPGLAGLAREDARAVEQVLIETHGLGKNGGTLINKINSIAKSNPAYAGALERGAELLKNVGYPGF